jgi:histone acetyltransferase (RNA polymerase elongator complex component)
MTIRIVPFFISHQGCPHRCVFCDQEQISGRNGSLPSGDEIRATLAASGGEPVEVAFYGGTFTSLPRADQERLLAPLQPLRAAGLVRGVRLSTRPDAIARATASFLREMGVTTVELGVQSMDDRVLAAASRGHTAADTEHAFAVLREAGIAVGAQLMPGLPGDTPATALASLRRVLALVPDCIRLYPTVVVAGTKLEELYRRGAYSPLTLDAAVSLCAVMLRDCMAARVPVIRIGLQPTDGLASAVVAGPWHPALRQLVAGELWYGLLERLVARLPAGTAVTLACAPSRISDLVGQRRRNVRRLAEAWGVTVTNVTGNATLAHDALEITHPGGTIAGTLQQQEVASLV